MADPAAGTFEVPGGHLEQGETARQAAMREWQEETGLPFPDGEFTGTWTSGIYQGFVYTIAREADLDIFDRHLESDPDGDVTGTETVAWWNPADLAGNPAVRPELLASLPAVMAALAPPCCGRECCADGCCGGAAGCQCAAPVAKAGDAGGKPDPKAGEAAWPGWDRDQELAALYATLIAGAVSGAVDAQALAAAWLALHPEADGPVALAAAVAFLAPTESAIETALTPVLTGLWTEGWVLGQQSAAAVLTGDPVDWAGWTPADVAAADQIAGGGLQRLLAEADVTIRSISEDRIGELADVLEAALRSDVLEIEPYHKPPGVHSMQADLPARNSISDLAAKLEQVLDNPARAKMVAHTEMARAQSAATVLSYTESGVRERSWLSAEDQKVCVSCDANEAAGALPMGEPFPSGAEFPPQHPFCRCCLLPSVPS